MLAQSLPVGAGLRRAAREIEEPFRECLPCPKALWPARFSPCAERPRRASAALHCEARSPLEAGCSTEIQIQSSRFAPAPAPVAEAPPPIGHRACIGPGVGKKRRRGRPTGVIFREREGPTRKTNSLFQKKGPT